MLKQVSIGLAALAVVVLFGSKVSSAEEQPKVIPEKIAEVLNFYVGEWTVEGTDRLGCVHWMGYRAGSGV